MRKLTRLLRAASWSKHWYLHLTLLVLLSFPVFGDENFGLGGDEKFVPRQMYDLEYLGRLGDKKDEVNQGVFQLTWNGKSPIQLDGFYLGKPGEFTTNSIFSYHSKDGWSLVPSPLGCGFGMSEFTIKPGQVRKFIFDLSDLEADFKKPSLGAKASGAVLIIGGSNGTIVSSEFPLP